jgi:hypothetical protein
MNEYKNSICRVCEEKNLTHNCDFCDKKVCEKCSKKCNVCDKKGCEKYSIFVCGEDNFMTYCDQCNKDTCSKCSSMCANCGKEICKKCNELLGNGIVYFCVLCTCKYFS